MYVCGVTVYDRWPHRPCPGGSRLRRDLPLSPLSGYQVTYVRNYTDVDDKIINRANQEGVSSQVIAERYIQEYEQDMKALGMEKPTHEPRATENIPQIISLVEKLVEKGFAYPIDGDVYFSVEKFSSYGKLSGRDLEEMQRRGPSGGG